jgi:prevent-host-death family protein
MEDKPMPQTRYGVEEARGRLGDLVDQVALKGSTVILTKRGEQRAVLISQVEFERLKAAASRSAREELRERLAVIREQVTAAKLDPSVVDAAVTAAKRAT